MTGSHGLSFDRVVAAAREEFRILGSTQITNVRNRDAVVEKLRQSLTTGDADLANLYLYGITLVRG